MLLEQCTTLTLGHAAPHSELHAVVERIRATLGHDRTVTADDRGFALGSAADKELIRVG